ncbi:Uncharacterised protein [Paenibacillus macerans]|uniref:Uncharacterized protein n=1 Tax=Paenibacillus macerans TaxID=44252 RepID=A0A090Y6N1_PAEMA|nr:hypothetical protein DJ90_1205 [Paenibacillus macerans]SUD25255.1 Uncharacterised protein [Paenibacillus macerans]
MTIPISGQEIFAAVSRDDSGIPNKDNKPDISNDK